MGENKCCYKSERNDISGNYYYDCDHAPKFIVKFNYMGKDHINIVCGVHKNSIEKWAARIKKRLNYDVKLVTSKYE